MQLKLLFLAISWPYMTYLMIEIIIIYAYIYIYIPPKKTKILQYFNIFSMFFSQNIERLNFNICFSILYKNVIKILKAKSEFGISIFYHVLFQYFFKIYFKFYFQYFKKFYLKNFLNFFFQCFFNILNKIIEKKNYIVLFHFLILYFLNLKKKTLRQYFNFFFQYFFNKIFQ